MSENPQRERFQRIETMQGDAARLLAVANNATIKQLVRLASRDLDEAVKLLQSGDIDPRPSSLRIVDSLVDLAALRLINVDKALKVYGPDATMNRIRPATLE